MQRRESNLIIETICNRLRLHYAEVPVITVHDSILTTPGHVETVKRIMLEEFERLGVRPDIKVEMPDEVVVWEDPFECVWESDADQWLLLAT